MPYPDLHYPLPPLQTAPSGDFGQFVEVYLATLNSPHSKRNMRRYIDIAAHVLSNGTHSATSLAWTQLSYGVLVALVDTLRVKYAPPTTNGILSAVKGVMAAAWRMGAMTGDDYNRACEAKGVPYSGELTGMHLPGATVRALLDSVKPFGVFPHRRAIRDYALLCLLFGAGLRRSEVVALDATDVDVSTGRVVVRHGKGDKQRAVFMNEEARGAVLGWLECRAAAPVTDTPALFVRVTNGDHVVRGGRLSSQAVWLIVKGIATAAGYPSVSPHDARRTFIGTALDAGAGDGVVSALVGHTSVDTTRRYDRRGERVLEEAARKVVY